MWRGTVGHRVRNAYQFKRYIYLQLQRSHEQPDLPHRKRTFTMLTEINRSTEANKASVRRFYDEVFNKKNRAAIDEFIDSNQVDHAAPPGTPGGIAGAKQTLTM